MSELLNAEAAITRFKENEQRVDVFVNEFGHYDTNTDPSFEVESLPSFMQRKEAELNSFGVVANGETLVTNEADLITANAAGSVYSIVLMASFAMTQNITMTKALHIRPGAVITTTGHTLAINGPFSAGRYQVFTGSGTVSGLKEAYPEWFGANTTPGTTNMTTALQAAMDAAPTVKLSATTYLVDYVYGNSENRIIGEGIGKSIIKQGTTEADGVLKMGATIFFQSTTSTPLSNIVLCDFTLQGDVATTGFYQTEMLAALNGVDNAAIERVEFVGYRGDGLIIGSTPNAYEWHNSNITVRDCIFDGVNWDNRNAISIIDGNNVLLENNYITRSSRTDMPGAIDIEPDHTHDIIRDIRIIGNTIYNNKGSNGGISISLSNIAHTIPPRGFTIENNTIDSGPSGNDPGLFIFHDGDAVSTRNHNVKVLNNTFRNTSRGFQVYGMRNVSLGDNLFDTTSLGPLIGYSSAGRKNLNISIRNNVFKNIDTTAGDGILAYTNDYLALTDNTFIDSGKADGSNGVAVTFPSGTSSNLEIHGNIFPDPANIATATIIIGSTHLATYNKFVPSLSGTTDAGAGTYSVQNGWYHQSGDRVDFMAELTWSAHTGTGAMVVNVPITATSAIGYVPVSVVGSNFSLAAGAQLTAMVDSAANSIRIYTSNAGTTAPATLDAAASLWISGSYLALPPIGP